MNRHEHHAKTPSATTGLFATLDGLLRGRGSGAPSLELLALLAVAVAALALPAGASAAVKYPRLGEITGPRAGESFGSLHSESVAVNDHNGHIYVADSGAHRVYDFESAADTSPEAWDGTTTPAGEFSGALAVAVDNTSGDVYVSDSTHAVIDKFDQDGNLIASFGDTTPSPNGQLAGLATPATSFSPPPHFSGASFGIAVDQATGDLYAIDAGHEVIDAFTSEGEYLPGKSIAEKPGLLYGGGGAYTDGIAVNDKSGELLASDSQDLKVYAFDLATGTLKESFGDTEPTPDGRLSGLKTPAESFGGGYTSVAANNTSGDLYVLDNSHEVVDRFDSTGKYEDQITGTPGGENPGVAVDQSSGEVYVSDNASHTIKIFGPKAVLLPTVETKGPTAIGPTTATLNGSVNPEGLEVSDCHFEYVDAAHYQPTSFNPYAGAQSAPCETEGATPVGSGSSPVAVHADITGLEVATTYHFRLVATNANGTETGEDERLETPPPPSIDNAAATEVTATSAKLSAEVNPEGAETGCLIEWGPTTEPGNPALPYEHTEHCSPFELGTGSTAVPVSLQLTTLSPNTTYHWRVVATNASGTTTGAEHTFVFLTEPASGLAPGSCPANEAFRTGPSANLPDCRAYEMVTPPHKNAALISDVVFGLEPDLAADGSRLDLSTVQCFAGALSCPANRVHVGTSFSFERSPAGWLTTPLAPPASQLDINTIWSTSADGGAALFSAPTPPSGEDDFYGRRPDGSFADVGPVTPPQAGELGPHGAQNYHLATADLSHLVYEEGYRAWPSFDEGESQAPSTYEYAGAGNEHPFLVGVSGEEPGSTDLISSCGTILPPFNSALSTDGRTVYFTALSKREASGAPVPCPSGSGANAGIPVPANALYARVDGEGPAARTVAISHSQCGEGPGADEVACRNAPPSDAQFEGASADGSRAFFTSTQQLTDEASQGEGSASGSGCSRGGAACNLYLYENPQEAPLAGTHLIDVSAGDTSGLGPQVQGVMAISADGTHVYFVANGVLAPGATPGDCRPRQGGSIEYVGACNLYLYQRDAAHPAGQTTFIATLPAVDNEETDGTGANEWALNPKLANVSPDGRYLLFTSHAALTPDSGTAGVEQVFRYDAQSESILRVSIGQRGFNDNGNDPAIAGCASLCPDAATIVPSAYSESRRDPTMSDDGSRVFFRSPLALTPGALDQVPIGATEGGTPIYAQNLYEWQAPGSEGCSQPAGCVRLLSDGRDTTSAGSVSCQQRSAICLIGTNASGKDVFFTTTDQLVPQDTDTQLDFYDARVGGGFAAAAGVTPCQSSEACHVGGSEKSPASSPSTPNFKGPEEDADHPSKHHKRHKRKHGKKHRKSHHHVRANANRGAGR